MKKVIVETFKDFSIGEFPYDEKHSAVSEHHYIKPKGYCGNWYDPIDNYQWRGMDGSWMVTEELGKHYMEQNRGNFSTGYFKDIAPILVNNCHELEEYQVSVNMRIFSFENYAGLVFNYVHNRKYMALIIENRKIKIIYRNQKERIVLGEKDIIIDDFTHFNLRVDIRTAIMVYFNNQPMINIQNRYLKKGKVGLIATTPAQFSDFIVEMDEVAVLAYEGSIEEKKNIIATKTASISPLQLINKIDLKNFGSGRQIRFGHLNKNDFFIVFVQHQKRMYRDSFAHISCLTAIDLKGNILWQKGEPNNSDATTIISADLPIQISDIDNDGVDEIIYATNFELIILNGLTGEVKKKMKTPEIKDSPYSRLNVDCLRLADFKGRGYQGDIIIKDRYQNVWAYDGNFNLLWQYKCKNTGHFPYVCDVNDDGKDEIFIGYDLVSAEGKTIWKLPVNEDHTDEIIYDAKQKRYYLASGNEDFNIVDSNGKFIKRISVGHAQRVSMAEYHNNDPEFCVSTFWGSQGIIYLFDKDGNLLWEQEQIDGGNMILPVNYDGKQKLILLNGNTGLIDASGDVVLNFPDDGHPTLCAEVIDIDNDGIDEIILWDQKNLYIYKSQSYEVIERYIRYPLNSSSNYRGEFLIKVKK